MDTLSVLIIDENSQRCESLILLLEFMEYRFHQVHTADEAQDVKNKHFDFIIIYVSEKVVVTLKKLSQLFPATKVVLLTDEQQVDESRFQQYSNFLGMLDFPIKKHQFKLLISKLTDSVQSVNAPVSGKITFSSVLDESFVGDSVVIRQVKKLITQVAKSNASVLVLGESGTGKEVVANCLHKMSKRNKKPYVPVNCGAIPRDLLESELFGHEKGAFTGALTMRKGRFEMAQEGTLFLDEIGDMPLAMQVKILRVLQERIFERVGGNKSLEADVRVIAATHRDLEDEVKAGHFREDLFYRLNVFPIEIPPLRERVEDIPLLFHVLNERMQQDTESSVQLTPEAMASIMQHPWPGNVRELSNLVERLGIMFPEEPVSWDDLPEKYQYDISHIDELPYLKTLPSGINDVESFDDRQLADESPAINKEQGTLETEESTFGLNPVNQLPKDGFDLKDHMANLEYSLIQQALKESDGVVAHAAKRLNMRRTTLVEKMKKYEMMFGAV